MQLWMLFDHKQMFFIVCVLSTLLWVSSYLISDERQSTVKPGRASLNCSTEFSCVFFVNSILSPIHLFQDSDSLHSGHWFHCIKWWVFFPTITLFCFYLSSDVWVWHFSWIKEGPEVFSLPVIFFFLVKLFFI